MRRDSPRYGNFPKRRKSRERPWNRASPAFGKLWEHVGKYRVDLKKRNITKPNTKITTPAQKYKFPSLPRLTPIPLLVPVTSTTPMENQAGDITPRIAIHIRAIKARNPRFEKVHIEKPSFFIFLYFMVAVYCHSFSLLLKRVMIMEKKRQKMWAASAMLTVNAPVP